MIWGVIIGPNSEVNAKQCISNFLIHLQGTSRVASHHIGTTVLPSSSTTHPADSRRPANSVDSSEDPEPGGTDDLSTLSEAGESDTEREKEKENDTEAKEEKKDEEELPRWVHCVELLRYISFLD